MGRGYANTRPVLTISGATRRAGRGRSYANKRSFFGQLSKKRVRGGDMQIRNLVTELHRGPSARSYSGRRGSPTRARPYIGHSKEGTGFEEKLHLPLGILAKLSTRASG
jgi:hypothetical protein